MSFDWKNYLSLAEKFKVISSGKNTPYVEGIKRTVISRAYYAGYHIAENHALTSGYPKPTKDYHGSLQTFYRIQFDNINHQEVSTILARTHKARKEADYNSAEIKGIDTKMESVISDIKRIEGLL